MIDMIISLIPGVVIIYCGEFFKRHIYTEIGNCGISVPAAKKNMVKWMYAQAIGPDILVRNGKYALILTVLFDIGAMFFNSLYNRSFIISLIINLLLIAGSLIDINYVVDQFSPKWLLNNNCENHNNWIETATEYARDTQYTKLYEFVKATK